MKPGGGIAGGSLQLSFMAQDIASWNFEGIPGTQIVRTTKTGLQHQSTHRDWGVKKVPRLIAGTAKNRKVLIGPSGARSDRNSPVKYVIGHRYLRLQIPRSDDDQNLLGLLSNTRLVGLLHADLATL